MKRRKVPDHLLFSFSMMADKNKLYQEVFHAFFSLFAGRFLPPPVPLLQTSDGLKAPDLGTDTDAKFPSVFLVNAVLSSVLPRSAAAFRSLPYDCYCRSVQPILSRRICKNCGLYHASLTSLKDHQRACGVHEVIQSVRPVRVAARRQRELMAIIAYNDAEDAEWIDDFLDLAGQIPVSQILYTLTLSLLLIETLDMLCVFHLFTFISAKV